MDIPELQNRLRQFAAERDWEQFHSPKNLAMALSVEAAELLERFQWLTEPESYELRDCPEDYDAVADELADVQIYLLRLADKLAIDLPSIVERKMQRNAEKYPVHLARGNSVKYNRRKV